MRSLPGNPRLSQMTGALCLGCENAIEHMTQAELDADYEAHQIDQHRPTEER